MIYKFSDISCLKYVQVQSTVILEYITQVIETIYIHEVTHKIVFLNP